MPLLDRSGWTAYASSYQGGSVPANALDGNGGTSWESASAGGIPYEPIYFNHTFWVDMGASQLFNYIDMDCGWPGRTEFFVSSDGVNWGNPILTVDWPPLVGGHRIAVVPLQNARWIKVHFHSVRASWFGNWTYWSSAGIAEFNVGLDAAQTGTLSVYATTAPEGTVGRPYNYGLRISQGVAPFTVAVQTGALPAGLSVDDTGLVSGIPTEGGTFTATIRVTDDDAATRDVAISMHIFKPGAPEPGATIAQIRLVTWIEFSHAETYFATGAFYYGDDYSGLGESGFPGLFYTFIDPPIARSTFSAGTKRAEYALLAGTDFTMVGFWIGIEGTLSGDTGSDPPNTVKVYGCYIQADYSDGTRMYSYPGRSQSTNGSAGSVTNLANSNDGSLETYATIVRTHFSGLGDPPYIRLDQFGEFTEIPVAVPGVSKNYAY